MSINHKFALPCFAWTTKECCLSEALVLNVFSQELQRRCTPSIWWASMWSLMAVLSPSFPHALHIVALLWLLPCQTIFLLNSIINFTCSSSFCIAAETSFLSLCSGLSKTFKSWWSEHSKAGDLSSCWVTVLELTPQLLAQAAGGPTWNFPVIPWPTTVSTKTILWSKFCNYVQH